MNKKNSRIVFIVLIVIVFCFNVNADTREENIEVFLVLDKSLSMVEEIDAVKGYVNNFIIDEFLITGDYLLIITFYGKSDVFLEEKIDSDEKERLKHKIETLLANGRFTDIGNALDKLKTVVEQHKSDNKRKYLLLITDGIQEAPPQSKYYSSDGRFNHFFLENTKTIQKKGWKIQILGIGSGTAVKEIAKELSGTYLEVSDEPTEKELREITADFLGQIEIVSIPDLKPIGKTGKSVINLSAKSINYKNQRTIKIENIKMEMDNVQFENILEKPFSFSIKPLEEVKVNIPVKIDIDIDPGVYNGNLIFTFSGNTSFSPASYNIEIKVKSAVSNIIWFILIIIFIIALVVFLLIKMLKQRGKGSSISFNCEIEDGPKKKMHFSLKQGQELSIYKGIMGLSITKEKTAKSVACVKYERNQLHIEVLDEREFHVVGKIPEDVLGRKIRIKKKDERTAFIDFQKV